MTSVIGVRNGRLGVFDPTTGATKGPEPITSTAQSPQVLTGGLRRVLLPLGVRLLQASGIPHSTAFVLVMDNDRTSVACLLGAMELRCTCVLVGKSRVGLLPRVVQETGITKIVEVDDSIGAVRAWEEPESAPHAAPANRAWLEDPVVKADGVVCLLTSGSVGPPKIVACTWRRMQLQGQSTHEQLFPDRPARIVCATPISHAYSINAIFTLLTSPWDEQSELVFPSDAQSLHSLLATRADLFTIVYGTPATYTRLLDLPAAPLFADVPYCAGTRLSLDLFRRAAAHTGLGLMQNYGSTETGDIAAWYLHGRRFGVESKLMESEESTYVGTLWPGVRVDVEDDGEVLVWTPWQSMGYVVDGSLQLSNDAPHRTSDRGRAREEGQHITELWLFGRLRPAFHLINGDTPGELRPETVEEALRLHPSVTDVLALMSPQGLPITAERILRIRVVLADEARTTVDELVSFASSKLGIPASVLTVEVVPFLPCSPAGKFMYC